MHRRFRLSLLVLVMISGFELVAGGFLQGNEGVETERIYCNIEGDSTSPSRARGSNKTRPTAPGESRRCLASPEDSTLASGFTAAASSKPTILNDVPCIPSGSLTFGRGIGCTSCCRRSSIDGGLQQGVSFCSHGGTFPGFRSELTILLERSKFDEGVNLCSVKGTWGSDLPYG